MTLLVLPGGTDVAEVAFFSSDALPSKRALNKEFLLTLETSNTLVRLPTGADGGYLLYLYVDQDIPPSISKHCLRDDTINGQFVSASGAVAFGGIESVSSDFKPNEHIRSDGIIPPGSYAYAAFRTEFPDEEAEAGVKPNLNPSERWATRIHGIGSPIAFLLIVAALGFQQYALALALFALTWFALAISRRSAAFASANAKRRKAEIHYPSIVVSLRSNHSIEATS